MGTAEFMSTGRISHIDGSMRSYTMTNLEEDSEISITIEAVTSSVLSATTSGAGMWYVVSCTTAHNKFMAWLFLMVNLNITECTTTHYLGLLTALPLV